MPGSLLGNAGRRVEDPGLLLGSGEFVDDLPIGGGLARRVRPQSLSPCPCPFRADRREPPHFDALPERPPLQARATEETH